MRSFDKESVSGWLRIKSHAKAMVYSLAACAILSLGALAERNSRILAIAVLAIIAIPILGFTLNQVVLTSKGREMARTVEDVRVLKEADARAFTQPFAAIMRKLSVQDIYPSPPRQILGRTGITSGHRNQVVAPIESGGEGNDPFSIHAGHRAIPGSFWASLTMAEQSALAAAAQEEIFDVGVVLWRRNQRGEHVIVIMSGKAHISIEGSLGERVIATRGPGDIVGERAALRPGARSATVVTATKVRALVIGTAEFKVFIGEYPRVLTEVLERQIYYRLTEDHQGQSTPDKSQAALRPALSLPPWTGQNCSICLTDITAFSHSSRRDEDRRSMRGVMYRMLGDAFNDSGVPWNSCYWEDRGDGTLIIVPPSIPTSAVVDAVAVRLAAELRQPNRQANAATRISLRVSTHVGPVTTDSSGVSGHAIDQAARLIQPAPLKRALANT